MRWTVRGCQGRRAARCVVRRRTAAGPRRPRPGACAPGCRRRRRTPRPARTRPGRRRRRTSIRPLWARPTRSAGAVAIHRTTSGRPVPAVAGGGPHRGQRDLDRGDAAPRCSEVPGRQARLRSGVLGEWSETTRSMSPAASAAHSVSRLPASRIGRAALELGGPVGHLLGARRPGSAGRSRPSGPTPAAVPARSRGQRVGAAEVQHVRARAGAQGLVGHASHGGLLRPRWPGGQEAGVRPAGGPGSVDRTPGPRRARASELRAGRPRPSPRRTPPAPRWRELGYAGVDAGST